MKIEIKYPPNIKDIEKRFGTLGKNVVFTYGDTLYNPSGAFIDVYLTKHEETHARQQGNDIEGWWKKYFEDDKFRLNQEIEAYHNQYEYFCKNKKDLLRQEKFLALIAGDLSGAMYGNICDLKEAKKFIKNGV